MNLNCQFEYRHDDFNLKVDLDLNQNLLGILGRSGAGKSTFLKNLVGVLKPTVGKIDFNHRLLVDTSLQMFMPTHQRHIALIFQQAQLFPHLDVRQNLEYGMRFHRNRVQKFSFDQIVDLLALDQLLNRKSLQLSGGESQRVSIGRALLASPDLVLLDEPLTGLDRNLKNQLLPFLNELKQQLNIPMIYVTHHPEELEYLHAPIVTMTDGILQYYD
ncbi:ATP-binding cassette domain-containing protein [Acinetobacter baylyi]|uniref:ATP-binding cassette domain-containing protein n=1 Tax=Acinetobacter baylyi TaxID=202950 RepID=UPI000EA3344B|nr:ATP-binding cassette domain-containing protein [Acinetobacter baylyi]